MTSAEIDAFLIEHNATMLVKDMAKRVGQGWQNLVLRRQRLARDGLIDLAKRLYHPKWSDEEIEFLMEYWGLRSDAAIARKLGRTVVACKLKAKRQGVTRGMAFWSCRAVAKLFGVDDHVVSRYWIAAGLIKATRAPYRIGLHRPHVINPEEIERFIKAHPERYEWRRMETGYHRNLAEAVWRSDPIFTVKEAASIMGFCQQTLLRHLNRGWLKGAMRTWGAGNHGSWRLRRSLLLQFEPKRY